MNLKDALIALVNDDQEKARLAFREAIVQKTRSLVEGKSRKVYVLIEPAPSAEAEKKALSIMGNYGTVTKVKTIETGKKYTLELNDDQSSPSNIVAYDEIKDPLESALNDDTLWVNVSTRP